MKLVTKMRKFVERMENVENMTERQLVKMLFKAEKMMTEYIATEKRKEEAYIALKEATNYKSKKTTDKVLQDVSQETIEDVIDEVAVTIQEEQILDNGGYIDMNINTELNISKKELEQERLVITKESKEKGLLIGAYHKDGAITYFSSSSSYDYPVAFGNPALTKEIKDSIIKQKPDFYQPITKNFKSIALFGKSNNQQAMVYLADAKRLVFEGYIGNMIFSTDQSYIDKDYNPLVTRADVFIQNGGKHNHVTDNMCTPSLKKFIFALIEQYMTSPKFIKAKNDIEYFGRVNSFKKQETKVTLQHVPADPQVDLLNSYNESYVPSFGGTYNFNNNNIVKEVVVIGGDDYEPEF